MYRPRKAVECSTAHVLCTFLNVHIKRLCKSRDVEIPSRSFDLAISQILYFSCRSIIILGMKC